MKHKIYLIVTDEGGYDSYDGHVVIADSPKEARGMCVIGYQQKDSFTNVKLSKLKRIGSSNQKKGIVLSSFNAG
jgi:hypothetical protein